ncbi:MAG: CHAT domain-containing protein [Desmonostoc vinosum HA7617-LM4]|nr:CHAT domain-containing protein [Desmonostoc vinosum HA7617-LM4]
MNIWFNKTNSIKVKRQIRLPLYFLIALLCILSLPMLARVAIAINPNTPTVSAVGSALQQGKIFYDASNYTQAVQVLQQAVREYRQQRDNLKLAVSLSNLSLAYQQLGAWTEAQQAITESLNLLKGEKNLQVLAQSLDIQGRLQLAMGQAETALATWQQTEKIYQQAENKIGVVRSLINQAQAWRTQGFYRRALEKLNKANEILKSQPDSIEKTVGLRSLGDALQVLGDLDKSQAILKDSLLIAQRLRSPANVGASFFSLGNNARTQQQKADAVKYYQQTQEVSPSSLTKVQAQLNLLSLLIEDQKLPAAQAILPSLKSQLDQLPPSRASIYARINLAQSLKKLQSFSNQYTTFSIQYSTTPVRSTAETPAGEWLPSTQDSALLLATAVQQSHNLGDKRAEAYALKSLGNLYEETKQWSQAQALTQQGLLLAQSSNAPDITYTLEWQLGRLLKAQKDYKGAIASYDAAVETLRFLRSDLVTVNQDVQFNFRDSVEPVYRESVELLLQSQGGNPDEKTLEKARQQIEALQLAELDNFFREACLQGQKVALDQVVDQDNPTAAILYPIILPEELQVIVRIPKQPLRHYSTKIPQAQTDKILTQLRKNLVNPAAIQAIETQSQQVYNWLLKPIESELQTSGVNTLVFVLDGQLRNIPMAVLYDGQKYLVEKYAIALSVGLQLLDPKPLVKQKLRALTAGLTQPPANFPDFAPLNAIKSEFNSIADAGVPTTSLLDQQFTKNALESKVSNAAYNVVHLATHGQFSSRAEKTFILANDGPINVKDFDTLLRSQNQTRVELLFLSACQTAAGDNRAALGLAGAAVRAGARSTLASLWQIDDQSTALFVSTFYRELKNNKITKAEALRLAQLELLKHPNYTAPSFWSAYVLIGNWL